MKSKTIWVTVSVLVLVALLLGSFSCAAPAPSPTPSPTPTASPVKPIELKLAMTWADTLVLSKVHLWIMQQLTERTKGQVKVTVFPPGAMGGATEMLTVVKNKGADMAQIAPAYWPAEFPIWNTSNNLLLMESNAQGLTVINRMDTVIPDTVKIMQREQTAQNIKSLYQSAGEGQYYITSKKAITTLADLKGLKVRSFGKYFPMLLQALGIVPVTVNLAEVYDAIAKGVIDAGCQPMLTYYPYKIYEVAPHLGFGLGVNVAYGPLIINLDTWNSLPADVKKIIEDLRWEGVEFEKKTLAAMDVEAKPKWIYDQVSKSEQDSIYKIWNDTVVPAWKKDMAALGLGADAETWDRILKEEAAKAPK